MTPEEQVAYDAVVAERDTLAEQLTTAHSERDEARGILRANAHREAFRQLARDEVRDDAIDALYQLTGYTPEDDEPDAEALTAVFQAAKEKYPFTLKPTEPAATDAAVTKPPTKPAPKPVPKASQGRGGEGPRVAAAFKVTKAQTSNPEWMLANWDAYQKAGTDGSLQIVD